MATVTDERNMLFDAVVSGNEDKVYRTLCIIMNCNRPMDTVTLMNRYAKVVEKRLAIEGLDSSILGNAFSKLISRNPSVWK